jgi:hypothetical protein
MMRRDAPRGRATDRHPSPDRTSRRSARAPLAYFSGTDLFLAAIIGFDLLTKHRIHAATIWGGAFLRVSQIGRIAIGGTDAWRTFAGWLIS